MKYIALFITFFVSGQLIGQELTVETIWKSKEFSEYGISGFSSLKDGESFTRIVDEGEVLLKQYTFKDFNGKGKVLVNLSNLRFNGKKLDFDNVELSKAGKKLLISTKTEGIYRYSYKTDYYIYDIAADKVLKLRNDDKMQTLGTWSPDETKIAYVSENDLYVFDVSNSSTTRITNDGKQNEIINGTTDWVYEEEFAITQGFVWSPDSKYLAYLRFDESQVKEFQMAMYGSLYPEQYKFKYPKAGEDNSKVTLFITALAENVGKKVELGSFEYLPRLGWSTVKNELIVLTMNRHQSELNYWLVSSPEDPSAKKFFTEKSETYIDVDNVLNFLSDGKSLLRTSEADGYNHVYQLFFDGTQKQLTKGNWDIMEFYGYSEKTKTLFYASSENGAIYKTLYCQSYDGKTKKAMSDLKGYHSAEFNPGMNYYIKTSSYANQPNVISLCDKTGKELKVLEDNAALVRKLSAWNVSQKEFLQIEGADGTKLNAWMIKPKNFDPTKKYPVYINIYCGPGKNTVNDEFEGRDCMYHQLLAQKGYIVFSVDPRGTQYRGAAFKKSTYLNLGKLETEDLIAVATKLKDFSYVDGNRIGIQGWSYGGFMTASCMMKGADVFKMGISVAPVTNWRYYDNIYTERFMRTPKENQKGYDDNSPTTHVSKLKGKLLLIHGSADDNVHYQNSMELITALVNANKQFDLFIYPDKNHGIYGGNTRNHLFQMMLDYTMKNL